MQKIDPTNSGTGTLHLNEQRHKQQSCISFQKEPNTTMPNTESNMKNMMSMLEKILISVDAAVPTIDCARVVNDNYIVLSSRERRMVSITFKLMNMY